MSVLALNVRLLYSWLLSKPLLVGSTAVLTGGGHLQV
ncbi:hypothetical protein MHM_04550 [Candidatus Mycoplasma haemominutum 'Birmingham 1']|uniref:Uncharacterized protein n=1 Tax=Candidatus Mycoplasma haematominutum 'Birmingham 1' TaxID=1116213 RepID=G8C3S5_9MOLU|nr:hypothetical protein MHM_04550 [Candidatus Mycoplasma haematominutum 'Birmingham 1']